MNEEEDATLLEHLLNPPEPMPDWQVGERASLLLAHALRVGHSGQLSNIEKKRLNQAATDLISDFEYRLSTNRDQSRIVLRWIAEALHVLLAEPSRGADAFGISQRTAGNPGKRDLSFDVCAYRAVTMYRRYSPGAATERTAEAFDLSPKRVREIWADFRRKHAFHLSKKEADAFVQGLFDLDHDWDGYFQDRAVRRDLPRPNSRTAKK